jgi:peptidoglycan/LPS O-acetylase OafA/YrhL
MKHDINLVWFDFFRGIAALLVLTGHLRALMFVDYSESTSLFGQIFYFLTGFGHQAVVIFFVLSGFFIIRSIHESVLNDRWNVKNYILNRMVRLWIVLLPALILTLLWDKIGLCFFKNAYTYTDLIAKLPGINPASKLGVLDFLGNLFFLQTIYVPTYGTNVALWSLSNEFWYYVLFPLIYFFVSKFYKIKTRIILFIAIWLCALFIGFGLALSMSVWLMGGVVYLVIKNNFFLKRYLKIKFVLSIFSFITVLTLIRFKIYPNIFNDFSLGIVTSFMLCVFSKIPMKNLHLRTIAKHFSNISYTVYLTHLSFAILFITVLYSHPVIFSPVNFIFYLLLLAIIMLYCYLIYFCFERNTANIKGYIKKVLKF